MAANGFRKKRAKRKEAVPNRAASTFNDMKLSYFLQKRSESFSPRPVETHPAYAYHITTLTLYSSLRSLYIVNLIISMWNFRRKYGTLRSITTIMPHPLSGVTNRLFRGSTTKLNFQHYYDKSDKHVSTAPKGQTVPGT
jgi:hypothetical protein